MRGRLLDPRAWLALLSVSLVALVAVVELEPRSPGPLAAAHAQEESLEAPGGCARCHENGSSAGAWSACLSCHESVARQIESWRGLHGNLAGADARACAQCHLEHEGRGFDLAGPKAFARAGVPDPSRYDHGPLGFTLAGKHAQLTCQQCHKNAHAEVLAKGARRFGGLDPSCASCHEDPHRGRMARACADCHGQAEPFAKVAAFAHDGSFPLVGSHGRPGCLDCHKKESARAVEVLAGREPAPAARTCLECHPSPHAAAFVAGVASLAGKSAGESCGVCHDAAHASFRAAPDASPRELHAASGFPLDRPHDRLSCESCHGGAAAALPFAQRYPGRSADACAACHADAHRGEFASGPFAGKACLDCHARHAFRPAAFGAREHAKANFPLEGSHAAVECARCHPPVAESPGTPPPFRAAPSACAACHVDAHAGAFSKAPLALACDACHLPTRFAEVRDRSFDHARMTEFPLTGAHARAACESCHAPRPAPDAQGRRFGIANETFPNHGGVCASCHADPHRGAFDRPGLPAEVGGRAGCARCHDTEGFAGAADPRAFDHALWTGWRLEGPHARAACAACHIPNPAGSPLARPMPTIQKPTIVPPPQGSACASCHADPHAGQFAREGAVDCARCHDVSEGFAARRFDHQRDTRFPLDAKHASVACAACHAPWPAPGGRKVVRYRPLGTQCADCHLPPTQKTNK